LSAAESVAAACLQETRADTQLLAVCTRSSQSPAACCWLSGLHRLLLVRCPPSCTAKLGG
jgi:hypothetical protein